MIIFQSISIKKIAIPGVLSSLYFLCGIANADVLNLHGRLLLQEVDEGIKVITPDPNSKIKNGYTIGVAIFDDGSMAEKQYIFAQNNRDKVGDLSGFGLYTFRNGDTLLMEFEASWDESGLSGRYIRVIDGTGRFSNATVIAGTFQGVAGPWYETIMTDIALELSLSPQ